MDVGILLDSSEDVSSENWQRIIAFVRAFVGRFTKVSPAADGTRFGLITYASNPAIHFNFRTLQGARLNRGEVQTLVGQTPRRPGTNRRIDAALQLAEQQLYSNRGGARQGAKKVSVKNVMLRCQVNFRIPSDNHTAFVFAVHASSNDWSSGNRSTLHVPINSGTKTSKRWNQNLSGSRGWSCQPSGGAFFYSPC